MIAQNLQNMLTGKKFGQINVIIALVVGIIMIVQVLLPVTLQATVLSTLNASGNLDTNTYNVLKILGLLVGVLALVYVAQAMGFVGGQR